MRPVDFTSRTLGIDVSSVRSALRDALRETPAAVVISELRDSEDFQATLEFAETGQLVFATAHSTSLVDAMRKLMTFAPPPESPGGRSLLAQRLKSVIHLRKIDLSGTEAPKDNGLNRMTITLPSVWLHNSAGIRNFVSDGLASILPRGSPVPEVHPTSIPGANNLGPDDSAGRPASGDSAPTDSVPEAPGPASPEPVALQGRQQPTGRPDLGVVGLAWAAANLIRVKNEDSAYAHLITAKRYLLELAHTIDLET